MAARAAAAAMAAAVLCLAAWGLVGLAYGTVILEAAAPESEVPPPPPLLAVGGWSGTLGLPGWPEIPGNPGLLGALEEAGLVGAVTVDGRGERGLDDLIAHLEPGPPHPEGVVGRILAWEHAQALEGQGTGFDALWFGAGRASGAMGYGATVRVERLKAAPGQADPEPGAALTGNLGIYRQLSEAVGAGLVIEDLFSVPIDPGAALSLQSRPWSVRFGASYRMTPEILFESELQDATNSRGRRLLRTGGRFVISDGLLLRLGTEQPIGTGSAMGWFAGARLRLPAGFVAGYGVLTSTEGVVQQLSLSTRF